MLSPIAFLIEHRKSIFKQYHENEHQAKKTWQSLLKILPQLSECMSFNTFKQYLSVLVAVINGLDKVVQDRDELVQRLDKVMQSRNNLLNELEKITQQKAELESRIEELQSRLDKVIQTESIDAKEAKRIGGWSVQKSKDGYYRCYRKIAKRVHSVYIGKHLNLKKAQLRITEKEKLLGLS
jgi:hypothetical protein